MQDMSTSAEESLAQQEEAMDVSWIEAVGVLYRAVLPGFARTSTASDGTEGDEARVDVAERFSAPGSARTPTLSRSLFEPLPWSATVKPHGRVAGVARFLLTSISRGQTPATPKDVREEMETWTMGRKGMRGGGGQGEWMRGGRGRVGVGTRTDVRLTHLLSFTQSTHTGAPTCHQLCPTGRSCLDECTFHTLITPPPRDLEDIAECGQRDGDGTKPLPQPTSSTWVPAICTDGGRGRRRAPEDTVVDVSGPVAQGSDGCRNHGCRGAGHPGDGGNERLDVGPRGMVGDGGVNDSWREVGDEWGAGGDRSASPCCRIDAGPPRRMAAYSLVAPGLLPMCWYPVHCVPRRL